MRAMTSVSQASGLISFNFAVSIEGVHGLPARRPPASEPAKRKFFLPRATGAICALGGVVAHFEATVIDIAR